MTDQPDPPDQWRVYEGDETPDPEPSEPPRNPYGTPPKVPYGGAQTYTSTTVVRVSTAGPKLIVMMLAIAVLGAAVAGAIAVIAAFDGGVGGIGGVDPKDPEDFAELVDDVEEKTGGTTVNWVGLYDGYAIIDVPYDPDDPTDNAEISYRWDGGGLDESSRGTATDERFDLAQFDPEVIGGMCDPVLKLVKDATPGECYVFIDKPDKFATTEAWFRAIASDDFGRSVIVEYDKGGAEVGRTLP